MILVLLNKKGDSVFTDTAQQQDLAKSLWPNKEVVVVDEPAIEFDQLIQKGWTIFENASSEEKGLEMGNPYVRGSEVDTQKRYIGLLPISGG